MPARSGIVITDLPGRDLHSFNVEKARPRSIFSEIGVGSTRQTSGLVMSDFLNNLWGQRGIRVYTEMYYNDPTVGGTMFAIEQVLRQVTWDAEGAGEKDEKDKKAKAFLRSSMADMCYDESTEILTERGFVRFSDLEENDSVAQLGNDLHLEFVNPSKIHCFDYEGDLYGHSGDAIDFLVTPNHRCLFSKKMGRAHDSNQKYNLNIHKAKDIFNKRGWMFKGVNWNGTPTTEQDRCLLEFIGFWLADGYVGDRSIVLTQKKKPEYVESLLFNLGLQTAAKRRTVQPSGSTQWTIYSAALARTLQPLGRSWEKSIPGFAKNCDVEGLRALLKGFAEGDGHVTSTGCIQLSTTSKVLADDLQETAMKAGLVANVLTRKKLENRRQSYITSVWSHSGYEFPTTKPGRGWYKKEYSGKVHCVTVPSGVVLTRRNGKCLWSGNSHTWDDFISNAITFLPYGWSIFEKIYKVRRGNNRNSSLRSKHDDGKIGWRKFAFRDQRTLSRWKFDDKGDNSVLGFIQRDPNSFVEQNLLPMDKSVLFRTKPAGGNPEGVSVLRNAYRPWFFKKRIEEIEGIGVERDLAGLPKLTPPEDFDWEDSANSDALSWAKEVITHVRRDEYEGLLMPGPDWQFELVTTGGSRQFDTTAIINRWDKRIALTMLSQFLMLGMERIGSFALVKSLADIWFTAIDSYVKSMQSVINQFAVRELFSFNPEFDGIDLPQIKGTRINIPDLADLSRILDVVAKNELVDLTDVEIQNAILRALRFPLPPGERSMAPRKRLEEKPKPKEQTINGESINGIKGLKT